MSAHVGLAILTRTGRPRSVESGSGWRRPQEIPAVASDVDKDSDAAVRLVARSCDELDAVRLHARERCLEVVDPKEQPHTPGELAAHGLALLWPVGAGQEQIRLGTRRPDHDQPLRSAWFVSDGEFSTSSNPKTSTKNAIAVSYPSMITVTRSGVHQRISALAQDSLKDERGR